MAKRNFKNNTVYSEKKFLKIASNEYRADRDLKYIIGKYFKRGIRFGDPVRYKLYGLTTDL